MPAPLPPTLPSFAPLSPLFGATLDELVARRRDDLRRGVATFGIVVFVGNILVWLGVWLMLLLRAGS